MEVLKTVYSGHLKYPTFNRGVSWLLSLLERGCYFN